MRGSGRFLTWALIGLVAAAAGALELDGATAGSATFADVTSGAISTSIALDQRFDEDARAIASGTAIYGLPIAGSEPSFGVTLDRLSFTDTLELAEQSIFSYEIGRIPIADLAGLVALPAADGASIAWKAPSVQLGGLLATTALLSPGQAPALTASDLASTDTFAPARIIGGVGLFLPERWGRLNAAVEYIGQVDIREFTGAATDDYLRGGYLTVSGSHPLGPRLFGSAALVGSHGTYGEIGGGSTFLLGGLGFAEIRGYSDGPLRATGTLTMTAASGDDSDTPLPDTTGDTSARFVPGPYAAPWSLAPAGLSNAASLGASGSIRPSRWLVIDGSASLLARTGRGSGGVLDATSGSAGLYGVEMTLNSQIKPFGDLELTVEGAIFLPFSSGIGVFVPGTERVWQVVAAAQLDW